MKNKKKIIQQLNAEHTDVLTVSIYEAHKEEIDLILKRGSALDKSELFRIKVGKYLSALMDLNKYDKSLEVIAECQQFLQTVSGEASSLRQFEQILTMLKGICLLRMGKLNESKKLFENLVERYPSNDNYSNWLKASKRGIIESVAYKISYTALAIYVLLWLLEIFTSVQIPFTITSVFGIAGLGSILIGQALKYFVSKKSVE